MTSKMAHGPRIEALMENHATARQLARIAGELTNRVNISVHPNPHELVSMAATVAESAAASALERAVADSLEWVDGDAVRVCIYTDPEGDGTQKIYVWALDAEHIFPMDMCAQIDGFFRESVLANVAPPITDRIVEALGEFYDEQATDVIENVREVCRSLREERRMSRQVAAKRVVTVTFRGDR
jgi:hypothetical protein